VIAAGIMDDLQAALEQFALIAGMRARDVSVCAWICCGKRKQLAFRRPVTL